MTTVAETLDGIKGLGAATQTALLDAFPTLDAIDKASLKELEAVKGVGPATAKSIKAAAKKAEKETAPARLRGAAKKAGDAATDAVEGTVVDLRDQADEVAGDVKKAAGTVGDDADDTLAQVRGALTSLQQVVTAALDAGRDAWPETEKHLKAALTSVQKTGAELVDAAKGLRTRV